MWSGDLRYPSQSPTSVPVKVLGMENSFLLAAKSLSAAQALSEQAWSHSCVPHPVLHGRPSAVSNPLWSP